MVSTVVSPRPSLNTPSDAVHELVGFATCPSCHTEDPSVTNLAVSAGADWRCSRCGSQWNAVRLATVAAYVEWAGEHTAASTISPQEVVNADDVPLARRAAREGHESLTKGSMR